MAGSHLYLPILTLQDDPARIAERIIAPNPEYEDQRIALAYILNVVLNDSIPLTLDTFKKSHELNYAFTYQELMESYEQNVALWKNKKISIKPREPDPSGKFRDILVHTAPGDDLTLGGIEEFIALIKEEKRQQFLPGLGTWLGPVDSNGHLSPDTALHAENIERKQGLKTNHEFAQEIYDNMKNEVENARGYAIYFCQSGSSATTIAEFIESALQARLTQLDIDLKNHSDLDEQLAYIVGFIKNCIRQHIFREVNHRVCVKDILNLLLLRAGIGIFTGDRRQFLHNSLAESIQSVRNGLIPKPCGKLQRIPKAQILAFCHKLHYHFSSPYKELDDNIHRDCEETTEDSYPNLRTISFARSHGAFFAGTSALSDLPRQQSSAELHEPKELLKQTTIVKKPSESKCSIM